VNTRLHRSATTADRRRLDRLIRLCESHDQLKRIKGRLEYSKFAKCFTREQLNVMWEKIKDKK
jgi:hypothetical protein